MDINTLLALFQQLGLSGQQGTQYTGGAPTNMYTGGSPTFNESGGPSLIGGTQAPPSLTGGYPGPTPQYQPKPFVTPPTIPGGYPGPTPIGAPPSPQPSPVTTGIGGGVLPGMEAPPAGLNTGGAVGAPGVATSAGQTIDPSTLAQIQAILTGGSSSLGSIMQGRGLGVMTRGY